MRELLFRGKRVDNGEWVYGDFMHGNERKSLRDSIWVYDSETQSFNDYEIKPETVGQYTGLNDKNGTKIFEGDILSEKPPMNNVSYIGYVAYDEGISAWKFMILNGHTYNGVILGSYSKSYKVIGNVHDNPELLGENGDD